MLADSSAVFRRPRADSEPVVAGTATSMHCVPDVMSLVLTCSGYRQSVWTGDIERSPTDRGGGGNDE
jgi:hypothetical protein